MGALHFTGSYEDASGREALVWRVVGSRRYAFPSLDFFTTIRGIDLWAPISTAWNRWVPPPG